MRHAAARPFTEGEPRRSSGEASSTIDERFCSLYRRERAYVRRAVRRFGVPRRDIEDAVQDVFLVLHRRWNELERDRPLGTWLYGVARRVSGNYRRSESRRRTGEAWTDESAVSLTLAGGRHPLPDECLALARTRGQLRSALEQLAPARRAVLLLVELQEMTSREIARLMGRPQNTVSSLLRLARRDLRRHLAGAGP